jgi:hypothetical protein
VETITAVEMTTTAGMAGTMPTITIIEPIEGATIPTNSVTIQVDVTGFTLVQPPEEAGMTGATMTTVSPAETTMMETITAMETGETGAMSGHIHYFMDAIPPTTPGEPAVNGTLMADTNTTMGATTTTAAGAVETTTTMAAGETTTTEMTTVAAETTTAAAGEVTMNATTVTSANTVYTFENVAPGEHIFAVELVTSDHTPRSPPVTAIVNVTVSGGLEAGDTATTAETMTTAAGAETTTEAGAATTTV